MKLKPRCPKFLAVSDRWVDVVRCWALSDEPDQGVDCTCGKSLCNCDPVSGGVLRGLIYTFGFSKFADKNIRRIESIACEKPCLFAFHGMDQLSFGCLYDLPGDFSADLFTNP